MVMGADHLPLMTTRGGRDGRPTYPHRTPAGRPTVSPGLLGRRLVTVRGAGRARVATVRPGVKILDKMTIPAN